MSKLWGGRFENPGDSAFIRFNQSLGCDYRLLPQDIRGSQAYAKALLKAGVLSDDEAQKIVSALGEMAAEFQKSPQIIGEAIDGGIEDVHSLVESELIKRVGEVGKKLHTGRSRNDQVATDFRLYAKEAIEQAQEKVSGLQSALVAHATQHGKAILPGYTHLQRAQPVLWGHYLMSFVAMLDRDVETLTSAKQRMDVLPLGSGAIAGNPWKIDREQLAAELGFSGISHNSMDAVSDRDFVCDFQYGASKVMIHLSRLAEDLILYASQEFQFVEMSDLVSTGSSLMPQKKNPDALELIRGKTGRVIGNLTGFLATLKGLGSCYNKDLQEDKECFFDTMQTLRDCLEVATTVIQSLSINPEKMLAAASKGYLNATDFADYLVQKGVPFRDAHSLVGKVVLTCSVRGSEILELTLEELQEISPQIGPDIFEFLELEDCIRRKNSIGGTSYDQLETELKRP